MSAVSAETIKAKITELEQKRATCLRGANQVMEQAKAQHESLIAQANTAHGGILELKEILKAFEPEQPVDEEKQEQAPDGGDNQHTG